MTGRIITLFAALMLLTSGIACASETATPEALISQISEQGAKRHPGYFPFHYNPSDGKLLLEISPAQLNQPFLFQSSLPYGAGSNDIGLDRGQLGETRLVQFERYGNKILLKQLNTDYRANTANPAEKQAVTEAFASSVIAGFSIAAASPNLIVVDYTAFLLTDIHRIGERLNASKQGSYRVDANRSGVHPARSKAFPDNTELEAIVTFTGTGAGDYLKQVTPSYDSLTVHLHHSLIRLPDANYQTRAFHPASGYWSMEYKDYATAIDESLVQRVIPRHRLEKKDPQAKMSEPVEPIIYYLDPGVPEPVRSALIDGAMWWNQAFEAIGFKNAFQVKDLPAHADPMDVRYNTIQWVHRATRGWSYGYSVIDPRTGEIIKGHVTLGSLRVRQDLLIALGLTSPFKNTGSNNTDTNTDISKQKAMALARIKQLSAHEVGHTLGIAHNFAASENNRASVMDYPHPLITLKNRKAELANAYDEGIGEWDKHVIAYGYQTYHSPEAEQAGLASVLASAKQKGLKYLSDPDARGATAAAHEGHLWDNGNDPIDELNNLLAVRKNALAEFGINSIQSGTPLSQLEENLVPIYLLHRFQLQAVARQIGGVNYHYEVKQAGQAPQGVQAVARQQQQRALQALIGTLKEENLTLSEDLLTLITPQAYGYSRTREAFKGETGTLFDATTAAQTLSHYIVNLILEPSRLNRLAQQGHRQFTTQTIVRTLLENTVKASWKSHIQQRVNHVVIDALVKAVANPKLGVESKGMIYSELKALTKSLDHDDLSGTQLLLHTWLSHYLESGTWKGELTVPALPPGSPI